MNEKKKLQPKVRFREFTGENAPDWEQRKFIDIVERLNKTEDNVKLPRIEFEDIVSGEGRLNKDLNTKKDDRKGIFFDENNILYGKLRPYLRKWYYARFAGVAIGDFWVLKIINNNHPLFIYYLIQTEKYQRVANDTSGTKMPRSDWKKVSESLFYIPNINEQKKISTIFNIIDNLITLHQRKLEQLEQLKNTLLSKMFPKSETNIPEIRFSGFTDAWKQRKLGEVVIRLDNLRIPITESNRVSGPTPYYGANGIQDYVEGYTHDGEYILIAEDGANDTNNYPIFRVHGKIWVNNHAHVLQTIDDIADNDYVAYALKSINIGPYLVGGSRSKLNADSLMKLEIKLPKLSEQIKVGQIFVKIDYQIKNYKQKLKNLKTIKKSLLNKLFI